MSKTLFLKAFMWQENIGLKPFEIDPIEKCILLKGMFY